ncbi:transposase, partial [Escherichia coli]|nr:transposase [Escherichia coli]
MRQKAASSLTLQQCRRRTTQEKIAIVQQSFEPGMTVSLVARQHGVAASQLFLWRKQ